jgi:RimJ/RimL family protein N-acetyltransferase
VAVPVVDPPRFRPAGSLDLIQEDLERLQDFRSYLGEGSWFEREAAKVLRRAIALYRDNRLRERDRILLFERDDELYGVTVLADEAPATVHLAFVGIDADLHGAHIDSPTGPRLSDSMVEATLDYAADLGFRRATAQVARQHKKSLALLERVGFRPLSRFDQDYDFYAVNLS